MTQAHPREATGAPFSIDSMRVAQRESWRALNAMVAAIRPGMRESEALALGAKILADLGMECAWHPLMVRFGPNTLKVFSSVNDDDLVLGEDDIYFIDMGPVFEGHEGDVGETFVTGSDPEMARCAADSKILFDRVRAIWQQGKVGGIALYDAAEREAEAMGWVLNLEVKGHRVSDYPHRALPPGGKLGTLDVVPTTGLWVLEIQIRHPTLPYGAFYEDMLDQDA